MDPKSVSRWLVGTALMVVSLTPDGLTAVAGGKPAPPPSSATVTWVGNGTITDGTTRTLKTPLCDDSSTPYLVWNLSGSKATSATITIPGATPGASMDKPSVDKKTGYSTFKYTWTASSSIDLDALLAGPVTATYNDAKNKAVLTVGQGCVGSSGPACESAPVPASQKTLANQPSFTATWPYLTASNAVWQDVPGCTNTYTYSFVGIGDYASTPSASTTLDVRTATGIPCEVSVVVTATNSVGSTPAYSAFGDSVTCRTPSGWGDNGGGKLGDGTTSMRLSPVAISAGELTVTAADGSNHFSCAVASGAVYCFGDNYRGMLGIGTDSSGAGSTTPVAVTGSVVGKNATDVSVGGEFSCAVAGGSVHCWGQGPDGQLGNGVAPSSSNVAVQVGGDLVGKTVTKVAAGNGHACALTSLGTVYCWGSGAEGQLGRGSTANSSVPVLVGGLLTGKTVTAIAGGGENTCAIADGDLYCWGTNYKGRLGIGTVGGQSNAPVLIDGGALADRTVTAVASSRHHTCAVADGAAYCWGEGASGELGNGSTGDSSLPVAVDATGALLNKTVTTVTAGTQHTCAIADGAAYCWGDNMQGQLGDGNGGYVEPPPYPDPFDPFMPFAFGDRENSSVPVAVDVTGVLSGVKVRGIVAGYFHTLSW